MQLAFAQATGIAVSFAFQTKPSSLPSRRTCICSMLKAGTGDRNRNIKKTAKQGSRETL